jgi:anhydro-N-acetylmuramic acid kinase
MTKNSMLVLGMMSGTSADGIDTAMVKISGLPPAGGAPPNLKIKLLNHTNQNFPPAIRKEILRVAEQNPLKPAEFSQLHARLGQIYADAALAACKKFRISPKKIDLIGNHGQTIFHQGGPTTFLGAKTASTLQIGDGSIIANLSGITTVSDFRPADIALGGQGAPLVPFADYVLYRHPKLGRVSLNIGGIANITVIPANAKPSDVFAFDTGPGNMLIDALVQHFTRSRKRFDDAGHLAMRGIMIPALYEELRKDPYLKVAPPKSTGRERYGRAFVESVIALGRKHKARPNDLIRVATNFTAGSIVDALRRYVLPKHNISQLIISGGGARNAFICALIADWLTPDVQILYSENFQIPVDTKEALAFAILAYETFHQRPSNIPSATGASGPAILGKISYAPHK